MGRVRSVVGIAFALVACAPALAFSSGISGYSGNPATNDGFICNICHAGGIVPTVTLTGPTEVEIGMVATYTLSIRGGQATAGGLDVSATDGALSVFEAGTQVLDGEVTHTTPRAVNASREVVFQFDWTAPATPGTVTMYGAGNSVDLAAGPGGDASAAATLAIDVVPPAATGPGETSGTLLPQLLVTGYDPGTDSLTLTYGVACQSTDHNVYYGPLDQVSSWAWSAETCSIGASGSYAGWSPGPGSWFFVIVGTNGTDEGSYGTSVTGGSPTERPPYATNACGQVQALADRCDGP